jgi:hypothetical protein
MMITESGVKILNFGVAKLNPAHAPAAATGNAKQPSMGTHRVT